MDQKDHEARARSNALRLLLEVPGWEFVSRYVREEMQEAYESLVKQMASQPEKLTGRAAFKYAMKYQAYKDLLDWVSEEAKKP